MHEGGGGALEGGGLGGGGGELLKVFIGGERVLRRVGESAMGWDGGV